MFMKPKTSRLNNQVKGIIFCPKHEPIHFAKLLLSVNSSWDFHRIFDTTGFCEASIYVRFASLCIGP